MESICRPSRLFELPKTYIYLAHEPFILNNVFLNPQLKLATLPGGQTVQSSPVLAWVVDQQTTATFALLSFLFSDPPRHSDSLSPSVRASALNFFDIELGFEKASLGARADLT